MFTADAPALTRVAPESIQGRGPWRHFEIVSLDGSSSDEGMQDFAGEGEGPSSDAPGWSQAEELLSRAFQTTENEERLQLCRQACEIEPKSEVAALALASAWREAGDSNEARKALNRAHKLAPKWEAAYYEDGKLWLALEDMERASAAFQRACDLMPTFSAAWSNLGATLGELSDTDAALDAFVHALSHDPKSATILNNIGVVTRELGRLDESENALRQVVSLAPDFVFGHYNLGHTRFLRGDYPGALQAYEEGQRRDPQKNRRQGCRLAIVRLANGDLAGAERDLWQFADGAPPEEREDLLLEAYEIGQAILTRGPAPESQRLVLERIAAAIETYDGAGDADDVSPYN
jgi:tetratricopeptide (TPR) repeat protein